MSVQQLKRVFLDDILPTWSNSGFDGTCGQFVEYLELDGSPQKAGEVRTRTVARQIYGHAHAAHLGVAPLSVARLGRTGFRQSAPRRLGEREARRHYRLDLNGAPMGSTIPASSLYHLWTAIAASTGDSG
ncbi:hypothetical protein [Rhizobium sp. SGZ-381]|uniref:hypothetical protein n=1 Tax=Rhizobium sp. SGZ-381 TaxID=3342800 RepID=UPI00366C7CCF